MKLSVRMYCTDDETRSQLIMLSYLYFPFKMCMRKGQSERDCLKREVGMIGT